jgi:hypothetical protein
LPYLFLNPRWGNQFSVLLLWSGIPIMRQLALNQIPPRQEKFWRVIAWGIPFTAWLQILLSEGDGALIASLVGLGAGLTLQRSTRGEARVFLARALRALVITGGAALVISVLAGHATFWFQTMERNVSELNPPPVLQEDGRLVTWTLYLKESLSNLAKGTGIASVPKGSMNCFPHNLPVGLLYWTGGIGLACAALLSIQFWPRHKAFMQTDTKALLGLPMLCGLAVYQLVDDIWLRPTTLALLLPMLALTWHDDCSANSRGLQFQAMRLIGLTGTLLICLALANPEGPGLGPSPLVQAPGRICLLFF